MDKAIQESEGRHMANKKYCFTGETKVSFGVTLNRIRALVSFGAVVAGELGGWIASENNLDAEGNAWVYGDAWVYGNARVSGDAQVYGDARVYGDAWVSGDAQVYGDARVSGDAWVYGDARVSGDADFFLLGPIGSRRAHLCVHADAKLGVRFSTGCFSGTEYQFKDTIQKTHGDNHHAKQYRAAIDLALMLVRPKTEDWMDEATEASTAKPTDVAPRTSAALAAVSASRKAGNPDWKNYDALIGECVKLEMDLKDAIRLLRLGLAYETTVRYESYKTAVREFLDRLSKRAS